MMMTIRRVDSEQLSQDFLYIFDKNATWFYLVRRTLQYSRFISFAINRVIVTVVVVVVIFKIIF